MQPLAGVSAQAYNANPQQKADFNLIFVGAILKCVNDPAAVSTGRTISTQNILDLGVASAGGQFRDTTAQSVRRQLAAPECLLSYKVASSNAGISAVDLSSTLASAAASGAFAKNVKQLALAARAAPLYNISTAGLATAIVNLNAQTAQTSDGEGRTTSLITMATIGAGALGFLGFLYGLYYLRKHYCRRAGAERDSRSSTASDSLSAVGAPTFVGRGYRRESSASPRENGQGERREQLPRRATDFTGNTLRLEPGQEPHARRPTFGADIIPSQNAPARGSLAGQLQPPFQASARGPSLLVPTAGQLHRDRLLLERSLRVAEEEEEEEEGSRSSFPVLPRRSTTDKPRVLHAL